MVLVKVIVSTKSCQNLHKWAFGTSHHLVQTSMPGTVKDFENIVLIREHQHSGHTDRKYISI